MAPNATPHGAKLGHNQQKDSEGQSRTLFCNVDDLHVSSDTFSLKLAPSLVV